MKNVIALALSVTMAAGLMIGLVGCTTEKKTQTPTTTPAKDKDATTTPAKDTK